MGRVAKLTIVIMNYKIKSELSCFLLYFSPIYAILFIFIATTSFLPFVGTPLFLFMSSIILVIVLLQLVSFFTCFFLANIFFLLVFSIQYFFTLFLLANLFFFYMFLLFTWNCAIKKKNLNIDFWKKNLIFKNYKF